MMRISLEHYGRFLLVVILIWWRLQKKIQA